MTDTEMIDWLEEQRIVVAGGRWANGCALDDQTLWWDGRRTLREEIEKSANESNRHQAR
jgi:hypothetical protein